MRLHKVKFISFLNSTEEATSSVEIDSATESNNHAVTRTPNDTTPNSDSYVSTSETIEPPASKAQVLEELKARIRELEGSPHYKCFICKVRQPFITKIYTMKS